MAVIVHTTAVEAAGAASGRMKDDHGLTWRAFVGAEPGGEDRRFSGLECGQMFKILTGLVLGVA